MDRQRRTKEVFARLGNGEQEELVVLRNNEISAVLLPVARYGALLDELEDLCVEAVAADRIATFDQARPLLTKIGWHVLARLTYHLAGHLSPGRC